jgi:lincosamide nucleotidyltransferase A/C/D/E
MTVSSEGGETRALGAGAHSALRVVYCALARSPAASVLRSAVIERARRRVTATRVSAADVPHIVGLLSASGVKAWVAGGWACDALLGEQTRRHGDLDLVIAKPDRHPACEVLMHHGFALTHMFDADLMGTAVVLVDHRRRRKVALHLVEISDAWPASLRRTMQDLELGPQEIFATGTIAGHHLACLSAPTLVSLHTGYELKDRDRRDVCRLCVRFSLPVPPGYECPSDANEAEPPAPLAETASSSSTGPPRSSRRRAGALSWIRGPDRRGLRVK